VKISSHVRPVSLPPASETFPQGTPCWVTGWGNVDNDGLWQGQLRVQQEGIRAQHIPCLCETKTLRAGSGMDGGLPPEAVLLSHPRVSPTTISPEASEGPHCGKPPL
jgi:hypothetical protein